MHWKVSLKRIHWKKPNFELKGTWLQTSTMLIDKCFCSSLGSCYYENGFNSVVFPYLSEMCTFYSLNQDLARLWSEINDLTVCRCQNDKKVFFKFFPISAPCWCHLPAQLADLYILLLEVTQNSVFFCQPGLYRDFPFPQISNYLMNNMYFLK